MNLNLFRLIHKERSYARYYYQPLRKNYFGASLIYELRTYLAVFLKSAYLPFNKKFNTQLFEGKRKSKGRMFWENLIWAFKYKEVCSYYFLYGLDLKGHKCSDYVAYTEFRVMRNILNFRQRENLRTLYTFNYLALTRDKFIFGQFADSLAMPHPKTIALVIDGKIGWYKEHQILFENLESLKDREIDVFCKETFGEAGKGAFSLKIKEQHYYKSGKAITFDELCQLFQKDYLIQEKIVNHPIINQIYPLAVNSIKMYTFRKSDGEVLVHNAIFKMGANGSYVDNAAFGGIIVGLKENGVLEDWGFFEPGKAKDLIVHEVHPDTGSRFAGVQLPYWEEAKALAKTFHKFYYGVPSIGWDIAITEDGPIFLEPGEDWEIPVLQIYNGGYREQFYNLHGEALRIKLRKY